MILIYLFKIRYVILATDTYLRTYGVAQFVVSSCIYFAPSTFFNVTLMCKWCLVRYQSAVQSGVAWRRDATAITC